MSSEKSSQWAIKIIDSILFTKVTIYNTRFHSVNCACTVSEEITCSVLKAADKLCKLMKALTFRKSENIFYFFKY